MLENASSEEDVSQIREELEEQNYIPSYKKKTSRHVKASQPLYFKSSDGFDIYVGKNNRQNDELTFSQSSSRDTWFHTQKIPGSHVIVRNNGRKIPDTTLSEASMLAALHSRAKSSAKVPVDYTMVKYVKKPGRAKPGMVIYDFFKTIIVDPDPRLPDKLRK